MLHFETMTLELYTVSNYMFALHVLPQPYARCGRVSTNSRQAQSRTQVVCMTTSAMLTLCVA